MSFPSLTEVIISRTFLFVDAVFILLHLLVLLAFAYSMTNVMTEMILRIKNSAIDPPRPKVGFSRNAVEGAPPSFTARQSYSLRKMIRSKPPADEVGA